MDIRARVGLSSFQAKPVRSTVWNGRPSPPSSASSTDVSDETASCSLVELRIRSRHAVESDGVQCEMRHRLGTELGSEERGLLQFRWLASRSVRVR